MDTLLLNADASPLSVVPLSAVTWQEAIKYLCLDRVTVLEWYDDWIVRSSSWETKVPAVVMVKEYIKKSTHPNFSRFNVILRDEFKCQYCSKDVSKASATLDHVIPQSMGGKTCWDNIVAACGPCNSRKGSKLIKPVRVPRQPTYYELAAIRKKLPFEIRHPSWEDYL